MLTFRIACLRLTSLLKGSGVSLLILGNFGGKSIFVTELSSDDCFCLEKGYWLFPQSMRQEAMGNQKGNKRFIQQY